MDPKTLRFRLGLFVIVSAILLAVLIFLFGGSACAAAGVLAAFAWSSARRRPGR